MNVRKIVAISLGLVVLYTAICFGYARYSRPKVAEKSKQLEKRVSTFSAQDPQLAFAITPEKLKELNDIFNQPFYFVGQGKQCTAYGSRDGKYVIKFVLQKPLVVKERFLRLPDFYPFTLIKSYKVNKYEVRKKSLYKAFMLSYQAIPEQTGTLFVHLNTTQELFIRPLLFDPQGCPVHIDVNKTQFVVQKRAHHIKPAIMELMWDGKENEAKSRIDQMFSLLYECAKKQIIDVDDGLIRNNNIGFLEQRAIYIDTGKLRKKNGPLTKAAFVKDLKRLAPFHRWLQTYYPNLALHFEAQQRKMVREFENSG